MGLGALAVGWVDEQRGGALAFPVPVHVSAIRLRIH